MSKRNGKGAIIFKMYLVSIAGLCLLFYLVIIPQAKENTRRTCESECEQSIALVKDKARRRETSMQTAHEHQVDSISSLLKDERELRQAKEKEIAEHKSTIAQLKTDTTALYSRIKQLETDFSSEKGELIEYYTAVLDSLDQDWDERYQQMVSEFQKEQKAYEHRYVRRVSQQSTFSMQQMLKYKRQLDQLRSRIRVLLDAQNVKINEHPRAIDFRFHHDLTEEEVPGVLFLSGLFLALFALMTYLRQVTRK
ncbi:MAG: hypothetical protein AAGI23_06960 [Bacteroidota bacterium]